MPRPRCRPPGGRPGAAAGRRPDRRRRCCPRPQTTRVCRPGNRVRTSALTPSAARSMSTGPGTPMSSMVARSSSRIWAGVKTAGRSKSVLDAAGRRSRAAHEIVRSPSRSPSAKTQDSRPSSATSPRRRATTATAQLPRRNPRARATPAARSRPAQPPRSAVRPLSLTRAGPARQVRQPPRSPARRRCPCPRVYQPPPWPRNGRRSAAPACPGRRQ